MKLSKFMSVLVSGFAVVALLSGAAVAQDKTKKATGKKAGTSTTTKTKKTESTTTTESGGASSTTHEKRSSSTTETGSYKAPAYGMAGCGLGSLIFKGNTKGGQSTAVTSNGLAYNQFFGISSGTSNCVETSAETAAVEREVYISANLATLSKEAAQGEGAHLRAFADVLGCRNDQTLSVFTEVSRSNHGRIFNSEEPKVVLENYLNVVRSSEALTASCARLGA